MTRSSPSGSFRLFQFSGIDVYLHWTWFLAAWYFIGQRSGAYHSLTWNVAEYLTLFAIVLTHEFGHAFASRQVGGESREIVLWPFGGIAFARVPPRPAAELWAVAAGPLVNVALVPVFAAIFWTMGAAEFPKVLWDVDSFFRLLFYFPEPVRFVGMIYWINVVLLFFNVLPIYPLDGGQMLRSLLWFKLGKGRSLQVATIIGFVGVAGLLLYAIYKGRIFTGMIALFLAAECARSYKLSQHFLRLSRMPRHREFACPACGEPPPGGPHWTCRACGQEFDPFSTHALCPHCQTPQEETACAHCGAAHPIARWEKTTRRGGDSPPIIEV